jgi:hypothetical protein
MGIVCDLKAHRAQSVKKPSRELRRSGWVDRATNRVALEGSATSQVLAFPYETGRYLPPRIAAGQTDYHMKHVPFELAMPNDWGI